MDKITQLLKQMHEMADEPAKMSVGGRVPGYNLTADEYQQNLVDFYNFGGIEVKAAPAADPAAPADPDPGPRIIPVDYQDNQEENAIFTAYDPVFGGNSRPDSNRYFSTQNYDDYIVDYDLTQPRDKSGDGEFLNAITAGGGSQPPAFYGAMEFGEQTVKKDFTSQFFGGAFGAMASTITARINRDNAAKIAATGGTSGSMYKFKGRVLSRAPGSKITNGQLGGMDQATALRNDEINNSLADYSLRHQLHLVAVRHTIRPMQSVLQRRLTLVLSPQL
jgi:hypothetical protein